MGYDTLYGCEGSNAEHFCHDCPEGVIAELARTGAGGYIKFAALASIAADPTDATAWQAGIVSGDIIIIPEISGSYDPGDPKTGKGYGRRKESYLGYDLTWTFTDPVYYQNYAFYNEIRKRKDLVPFFLTSSLLHLFDQVATIKAKDVVSENADDEVVWEVTNTVSSYNLPSLHVTDAIIDLFACATF